MKLSLFQLVAVVGLLLAAGCTSTPKSAPASPGASAASVDATPSASSSKQTLKRTGLPAGEFAVLVESEPDGGTVVVNGIPVGKAPQRIVLPGTPRGFFRDQVSLKVRFIAADASKPSQTVEELLTPLDRIPATVKFTPAGASRVARK